MVLSAASPQALSQRVRDLQHVLASRAPPLSDIAYTLGTRRDHLKYRTFAITLLNSELDFPLESVSECFASPEIILVFTGQGAQWAGMARELLQTSKSFKDDIRALDEILRGANATLPCSIEGQSHYPRTLPTC